MCERELAIGGLSSALHSVGQTCPNFTGSAAGAAAGVLISYVLVGIVNACLRAVKGHIYPSLDAFSVNLFRLLVSGHACWANSVMLQHTV